MVGINVNKGLDSVGASVGNVEVEVEVDGVIDAVGTHEFVGEEELLLGVVTYNFAGEGLSDRSGTDTVGSQADGSRAHTKETVAVGTCDDREATKSFVGVGARVGPPRTAGSPFDGSVNVGIELEEGNDKEIGTDVAVWHSSGIKTQTKGRPSVALDGTNEFHDIVGLGDNGLGCSHAFGIKAHTSVSVGSWEIADGTFEGMRV